MKSTLASASLLTLVASSSTTAAPSSLRYAKRQIGGFGVGQVCTSNVQPSATDVLNALIAWNSDVVNVNDVLNNAATDGAELGGLAQGALDNAMDEPTQLGVLACIPALADAAEDAINSAAAGFQINVLDPLMDVVVNAANLGQVDADLGVINQFRCCTLLPDLDVLWLAAGEDEGLVGQVNLSPPRPNACTAITC